MRSRTLPSSLAARVYLLAFDVEKQKLSASQLPLVVRGAVLAELNLRGGLTEEDGKVRASGTMRTGDEVLDDVLRGVSEDRPRSWRSWLRRNARQTLRAVRHQLASTGIISVETEQVLGIFRRVRVTVNDPAPVIALRHVVESAVRGTGRVSPQDATLVALVAIGELRPALSRKDRKTYADRIAELTEQGSVAAPELRKVLRQIKAARTAAQAGGG